MKQGKRENKKRGRRENKRGRTDLTEMKNSERKKNG